MVDIHDDAFRGIHRTPLSPDGGKADMGRKMLGPSAGAVVKLSRDEDVITALAIGEGIETALSLPMLPECFGLPVWACLSAGNLQHSRFWLALRCCGSRSIKTRPVKGSAPPKLWLTAGPMPVARFSPSFRPP